MGVIEYLDFDVEIAADGPAAFRSRVLAAPVGAGASAPFPALDDEGLKRILLHVSHPRDAVRVERLVRAAEDEIGRVKGFGGGLFGALFGAEIGEAFAASRVVAAERSTGLRLRLRLTGGLAEVPWEFLYHPALDRFVCLSVDTPLVRYLDVPEPVPVVDVARPLRVLVMISDPTDHPRLDVEGELRGLSRALEGSAAEGLVTLERLDAATMEALHDRLLEGDVHVFHYVGHGGFDEEHQDGLLVLEDAEHRGALVPGDDLGVVLQGHRALQLAVLNTCQGAQGSPRDPFAGTAQGLIQQGVPAVIAMQFPISDVAATSFARRLYSTLALGYPVDAALCEARKTVYLTGNRLEWATPVLYTRSGDGRLFSIEGAAPVHVRPVEVDPLAPADAAAEGLDASEIVADGTVVTLDEPHGALLSSAAAAPGHRIRVPPLDLRPRDFPELLGRDEEVRTVTAAFLAEEGTATDPVEIFGPPGVGKTALARNVAHHPSAQFPQGIVYTSARQSPEDLLRFLFQTFYESDRPILPSEAELTAALHDVDAFVLLDDLELDREALERLTNVAVGCLFVLCSDRQLLWQGGPAFGLRGLAPEPALELLERRLDRPLTEQEREDAGPLIAAVEGLPLLLVQAASRVRAEGLTVAQVAREAEERESRTAPLLGPASLEGPELRVAAVLAAAGAPVGGDLLAAAAGTPEAPDVARRLEARGLVTAIGDRFALAQPPTPAFAAAFEAGGWADEALERATSWVLQHVLGRGPVIEEADALVGIMGWGRRRARWPEVVRLGRAIERAFAIAARWDRWGDVLERILEAARQGHDRAQEAWALHQLGTRDVGLSRIPQGREQLQRALEIREELRDRAGIDATRANLRFTGGTGGWGKLRRWLLGGLVAVAVIVGVAVIPNGEAGAAIAADPGSVEFPELEVGTRGDPVTVTISSTGDRPLAIGRARLEPGRGFRIDADTCSDTEFPGGTSCSITVRFIPRVEGERTTTLVVPHNAEGSPLRIELTGTAVPPETPTPTPTEVPYAEIAVDVPEGGMVFPNLRVQQVLTIRSTGTADVVFEWAFDQEGAGEQFLEQTDCTGRLAPQTQCSLAYGFAGNFALPTAADLVISTNTGAEPITVPFSGVPAVRITPGSFAWNVDAKRYESTIAVANDGTAPFGVLGVTIEPSVMEVVSDGCTGTTVNPNGTCSVLIASSTCSNAADLVVLDTTADGSHRAPVQYDQCVE